MYPSQNAADSKTLWMGDIEHWMDENYVCQLYQNVGLLSVKVIRDKITGLPAGYAFVEFQTHEMAQHVLNSFNGSTIPGTHKTFRLNWGVFGGGGKPIGIPVSQLNQHPTQQQVQQQLGIVPQFQQQHQIQQQMPGVFGQQQQIQQMPGMSMQQPQADYSIYVQDLDPTINEQQLAEFFRMKYKSVISSKIIYDSLTKLGKGYGFVKFGDQGECQRALSEMNGTLFRGRHIKTNSATWKSAQMSNISYQQQQAVLYMNEASSLQNIYGIQSYGEHQQNQMQQMMMQQQMLSQQTNSPSVQVVQQNKITNNPNLQRRVEKPNRNQTKEEYSESSMDYIINKIEYDVVLKYSG